MSQAALDGEITIGTTVDTEGIDEALKKIKASLNGLSSKFKKAFGNADKQANKLGSTLKKIAKIAASIAIGKIVFDFGKQAITAASDLQEVQNIINVTFGRENLKKIDDFCSVAIDQFGLSALSAKKAASQFAAMGSAAGLSTEEATDMAIQLTALSGDFASLFNINDYEAVLLRLSAVYTGETEALKTNGIIMTEANLQQYAYSKGIETSVKKMDARSKAILRYNYLMEQTNFLQGDFVRTEQNWANELRVLQQYWNALMVSIGGALTTVLTPVLGVLISIVKAIIRLVEAAKNALSVVFGIQWDKGSQEGLDYADTLGKISDGQQEVADSTKDAAKEAKKSLAAWDEINVLQQDKDSKKSSGSDDTSGVDIGMDLLKPYEIIGKQAESYPPPQAWVDWLENMKTLLESEKWQTALANLKEGLGTLAHYTWEGLIGFYEHFLKPVGSWVMGEGLPRLANIIGITLQNIDYESIITALNNLWDSLAKFTTEILGEGLLWFLENVLSPFTIWASENIIPPVLQIIADAINIITDALIGLQPLALFIFENILSPIASTIGTAVANALKTISEKLHSISEWMDNNPEMVASIETIIGLFVGWKAATSTLEGVFALLMIRLKGGEVKNATGLFKLLDTAITKVMGSVKTLITVLPKLGQAIGGLFTKGNAILLIISIIAGLIIANWDKIKPVLEEIWGKIQEVIENIKTKWEELKEGFANIGPWLYEHIVQPVIDKWEELKTSVSEKTQEIKDAFTEKWTDLKQWVFDHIVTPVVDKWEELKTKIKEKAQGAWDAFIEVFKDIGQWVMDHIVTPVTEKWDTLKTNVKEKVTSMWETLVEKFGKIKEWVEEHIVTPVKDKIKGLLNTIIGLYESMINKLIRGVNKIGEGISDMFSFTNPFTGTEYKLPMPTLTEISLPRLATGAVIPPNEEFMAVLGDQKKGMNIEAPADLIRKIVREEIQNSGGGGQDQKITIEFKGTMAQFVRALNPEIKKEQRRQGSNLITGGTI